MLVEIVDGVLVVTPTALTITLTGIASDEQLCLRKPFYCGHIAVLDDSFCSCNRLVELTGGFVRVVGPHGPDASLAQAKIAAAATREKRDCVANFFARS